MNVKSNYTHNTRYEYINQMINIFIAIINFANRFHWISESQYNQKFDIFLALWALEMIVDAICIFLTFDFNERIYKIICGKLQEHEANVGS